MVAKPRRFEVADREAAQVVPTRAVRRVHTATPISTVRPPFYRMAVTREILVDIRGRLRHTDTRTPARPPVRFRPSSRGRGPICHDQCAIQPRQRSGAIVVIGNGPQSARSRRERVNRTHGNEWWRCTHPWSSAGAGAGACDDDAADVFQEVFQAVAAHLSAFRRNRAGDTFRGWLRTITRNKVHDHFRRFEREPPGVGGSQARDFLDRVPQELPPEEVSCPECARPRSSASRPRIDPPRLRAKNLVGLLADGGGGAGRGRCRRRPGYDVRRGAGGEIAACCIASAWISETC